MRLRYGRDIRPRRSDRCFKCHGQDEKTRAEGLRLDVRDGALAPRKAGCSVVPGKPDESLLIQRILTDDPDDIMPPPSAGKKPLTPDEKALLRRWIAEGGEY